MTDNERIAEWLEYELAGDAIVGGWSDDVLTVGMPTGKRFCVFDPSTDITIWHRPNGLLGAMNDKGLIQKFTDHLIAGCGITVEVEHDGSMWLPIERVPEIVLVGTAQLTAALCAVISCESS